MINTQYINLNMTPSGVFPILHCSQYDIGRPLGFAVYDGSAEMDLDDYTVTIEATRTDGTPITAAVTTDGNIGAFVTTATITNKDDLYQAQLVIVDGNNNRVASLPFMMHVIEAAMDENSEAIEEDAPLYQQYNSALQSMIVAIRADLNAEAATRAAADTTLRNNINAEALTRAAEDAVLSARMDTFSSLPSGSTSGNAELLDIRVSANGATYPSAGDAVRAQVENLDNVLSQLNSDIGSVESIIPVWHQGYVKNDTGAVGSDNNYCYSDRIRGTGYTYTIDGIGGYKVKVVKYNVSGSSYGGVVVPLTGTLPVQFVINTDESFRIQYGLGNSATTPESITADVFSLFYTKFTDDTLSVAKKAADASATGAAIQVTNGRIDALSYVRNSSNVYSGVYRSDEIINPDGTITTETGYGFGWDYIPVSEGDCVSVGALEGLPTMIRSLCAYDSTKTPVVSAGISSPVLYYTVPSGISYVKVATDVSTFRRSQARINLSDRLLPYEEYYVDRLVPVNFEFKTSSNVLIPGAITRNNGFFMRKDGTTGRDSKYAYTHYISVHEGDVVYLVQNGQIEGTMEPHKFRFIAAFDNTLSPVSASGAENVRQYTVPSGVTYIVCTIWLSAYNTEKLAININDVVPYEQNYSYVETVEDPQNDNLKIRENALFNSELLESPFTTLPKSFVGNMYYKPLGELEHPYICLVTDDGRIGLNTYTIPMVISKNVPCTFAIMSSSEVMQTAADIAIVKDAVDNHGCEIAQHGGVNWTEYTERELNEFFDKEDAFFAANGFTAKSAVVPSHYNSKMISATAGGRYGVVRSGFNGYYEPTIYYGDYLAGARSNLYMLPSFNPSYFETLERNKQILDYAVAHNKIMIIYWHENALTDDHKAIIEGIIDYAKTQPITFITLGDIATRKVI